MPCVYVARSTLKQNQITKSPVFKMVKTTDPCSARQQRHLAFISEFTTYIQHISEKDKVVSDGFLRSTVNTVSLEIYYMAMVAA